jgi:alanine-glyoxylate transaminase/serine-glyoxylate transaminase/serine-pyruvate transaminase
MPEGCSADSFRKIVLDRFNLALGNGLGRFTDRVFRIGHLGDFNDLMLMATLCGVEMGLFLEQAPHRAGGVAAAMRFLTQASE